MKIIVVELQTNADGTFGNIVNAYDNRADAEEKYHTILMYAAKSQVMIHAAVMIDERGNYMKNESFVHPAPEPEPAAAPEEEPAEEPEG